MESLLIWRGDSMDNNNSNKSDHEGKKHKKGKPPTIIPKEISDWINGKSTNTHINNWKKGGGLSQK